MAPQTGLTVCKNRKNSSHQLQSLLPPTVKHDFITCRIKSNTQITGFPEMREVKMKRYGVGFSLLYSSLTPQANPAQMGSCDCIPVITQALQIMFRVSLISHTHQFPTDSWRSAAKSWCKSSPTISRNRQAFKIMLKIMKTDLSSEFSKKNMVNFQPSKDQQVSLQHKNNVQNFISKMYSLRTYDLLFLKEFPSIFWAV